MKLDLSHRLAALDIDVSEDLLEQRAAWRQLQPPGLGFTAKLELKIALQRRGVAAQYGEEQLVLPGRTALRVDGLPALLAAPRDALGGDAIVLADRLLQQPEQAVVAGEYELAPAGQGLRQGTKMLFLNEVATHHGRPAQLFGKLWQVESLRHGHVGRHQQGNGGQAFLDGRDHASARSTASTNTRGEASSISRLAISTATCTLLPRVMRSPVSASRIR